MKEVVIRVNPVNSLPIVFDRDSAAEGQIDSFINGQVKRVGISDYYAHCEPMSADLARKVAKDYARHFNIPEDEVVIRERLKKTVKPHQQTRRKTDDANLVLVKSNKQPAGKQEASQDYRSLNEKQGKVDNFANTVQGMQDAHDEEKGKATAKNPEGAVVKPADKVVRTKRKYERKERSAKSKAAYERYLKELSAQSPQVEVPERSNNSATSEEEIDPQTLKIAIALARVLKGAI